MKVPEQDHPSGLYDRIVLAVAGIAAAVGVLVLIGWLFDLDTLKSVLPGLTAMKVNAAVGFILSGIALWGIQTSNPGTPWRLVSQICAGGLLLGGLLVFIEHLSGLDFGIDQLLIPELTDLPGDIPGRVAVDTAISFIALGAALLLVSLEKEGLITAIHALILLPLVLGGANLIGYGYDIEEFLRAKLDYTPMALPTALVFVLLAIGVAAARPHYPFRRLIASDTDAGRTVRRLLPAAIFFTLLLGWSIHYAYHAGLIDEAMVPALFSAATIGWASLVVLVHGGHLYHAGLQRDRSHAMLNDYQAALRTVCDMLPIGLWILDEKGKVAFSNDEAQRIWGGASYLGMEHLKVYKGWRATNGAALTAHEWPGARAFEKGETTLEEEIEIEAFDGQRKIILDTAVPLRKADGTIRGIITVNQDITQRKRSAERSSYLAAIVESSQDAIIGKTLDGIITSWNKGAKNMYGYDAEEVIGLPLSILIPPDHEDELPAMLEQIRNGKHFEHFETVRKRKDDKLIYVSLSLSPITEADGSIVGAATVAREITELKRTEEQLRSASIYARSLIEANLDPLVTISSEGLITDVNEATIQATGVPREQLVGSDFSDYFSDPDLARAGYQQAFAKGFVRDYPLSLRHKSGTVMEVLYNASVYRNDKGEVAGVFAAARDITERKRAEEERLSASAYARSLIEASLDPLVTISADGKITDVNEATIQATGVPRETLIASDFSEYFTDPDLARAGYQEVFAKGFVTDYPLTLRHVSGKVTEVLYNASVYWNVKGQVAGVFASARDITERKLAESALLAASMYARSLIEANLDPLVTISAEGLITDVNEATIQATGVSRDKLIGSDFSEYFTDPDLARAGYQEAFAKGYVRDYPLSLCHVDGLVMEVLYNASVYRNEKGEVAGVFAAARDITERKQAEKEIKDRMKELQAFFHLSELAESEGGNLEKLYQELANILPQSWQYTEIACARIVMGKSEFRTDNFRESIWMLTAPIKVFGSPVGKIEVGYLEQTPVQDEGPFLKEERRLINAIAERVGHITERTRADEELHAASLYARSLIEASLDPLVTISAEGKITDVNEATVQATGVPRKVLIGSDFSEYFTEPDKARAGYLEVFAKGFVMDYPLALRHVSGRVMEVLYNASVYRNAKGEVTGVFASARDITERKRAEEERLTASLYARSLIEASLDPLVTISVEGKITDVNEATIQVTGVPRKLLIGSDFSAYFTEPDIARAGYQEAFSKGFVTNYPLALRAVSGKVTDVLYNASVYRDNHGKVAGVFAAARDITERKQAELELRKYHEQLETLVKDRTSALESANKDLEGFAYSVSHDLRVPLRAIDGFSLQVYKRYADKLDDEGKRYLTVVRDNTKKMSQLIDDILAFSRMGRLGMSMSEINMEELAHIVYEELKPTLAERELTMQINPLPHCRGDQSMLHQVWVNLLSNALKFTRPKEAALVEVGGRADGAEIIYYVKDNGAGFDMQYAEKLFGVFQRLHGVEEFEGTGIGLAIIKRIITRHGGRVWAEGKINEGATFYFALPI